MFYTNQNKGKKNIFVCLLSGQVVSRKVWQDAGEDIKLMNTVAHSDYNTPRTCMAWWGVGPLLTGRPT